MPIPSRKSRATIISERTLMPVSMIAAIVAAVFWFATLNSKVEALGADVDERAQVELRLSDRLAKQNEQLRELNLSVGRIEGKLDVALKRR